MNIMEQCKQTKKRRMRLPVQVYLAYLLVCTLLLTGVSFSRYASTSAASDGARVAKGKVEVSFDQNNKTVNMEKPSDGSDGKGSFQFSVTNCDSQIAIQYDVIITLEKALPGGVAMKLDDKTPSGSGLTYTFSDMGIFQAGVEETYSHTLTFTGDYDIIDAPSECGITISVCAEQID